MNRKDRAILYGLSIGDGCVHVDRNNCGVLVIGHSPKQLQYLEYKAKLLYSIFGGKALNINSYQSNNKKTGKQYTNYQIAKGNKYFRLIRKLLYKNGKKTYSRQILNYLDGQALALWFMDDGSGTVCKNKNKDICGCMTRLSTYCSYEEAEIIRQWFLDKYDLDAKFDLDKRNNLFNIRFNTHDSKKFASIVLPYMEKSMMYKLSHIDIYFPRAQDTPSG